MVEQRPFKPLVGGSSPPAPTNNFTKYSHFSRSTPLLSAFHTHESHKYSQVGHSKILGGDFSRESHPVDLPVFPPPVRVGARFLTSSLNSLTCFC